MLLGEWANELDPNDLLEMFVTKVGVGSVKDADSLITDCDDELPSNKMSDYNPDTTMMTFMFDRGYWGSELPEYFVDSKGIIEGESNCELIYEDDK